MTDLLLDTHVVLWAAADDPRLGAGPRAVLADADRRWVSAATAYEIATKVRAGKLPGGQSVLSGWTRLLRNLQATELPLTVAHMARAGGLPWSHRDPFDRMLVAQTQVEGLSLLTNDRAIRQYSDVRSRWSRP